MAQPPTPHIPTHGAVDLSALKARPSRPPGEIPEPPARSAPPRPAGGSALGVGPEHAGAPAAEAAVDRSHGGNPWVVEVNEENFGPEVMTASMTVPVPTVVAVIDRSTGACWSGSTGQIRRRLAASRAG